MINQRWSRHQPWWGMEWKNSLTWWITSYPITILMNDLESLRSKNKSTAASEITSSIPWETTVVYIGCLLIKGSQSALRERKEEGLHLRYKAAAKALRLNAQTEKYNGWTNEVSRGGIWWFNPSDIYNQTNLTYARNGIFDKRIGIHWIFLALSHSSSWHRLARCGKSQIELRRHLMR